MVRCVIVAWLACLPGCLFVGRIDPLERETDSVSPGVEVPVVSSCLAVAGIDTPVLFFSDLESGPASGGLDDLGPFITIYGERFGATPGTVTLGATTAARIVSWEENVGARGLDRIVMQPGALASGSQPIVVVANGKKSNALPFAVRDGRVLLVDAAIGSVDGTGAFASPFDSLFTARAVLIAGDVLFIKGGIYEGNDPASTHEEHNDLILRRDLIRSGTETAPIAIVGYPGVKPRFGPTMSTNCGQDGVKSAVRIGADVSHLVLANFDVGNRWFGFTVQGEQMRVVGVEVRSGCDDVMLGEHLVGGRVLGLRIGGASQIQSVGLSVGPRYDPDLVRDVDIGWLEIEEDNDNFSTIGLSASSDGETRNITIHDSFVAPGFRAIVSLGGDTGVLSDIRFHNDIVRGGFVFYKVPLGLTLLHNSFVRSAPVITVPAASGIDRLSGVLTNNLFDVASSADVFAAEVPLAGFSGAANYWGDGKVRAFDALGQTGPSPYRSVLSADYTLPPASPLRGAGIRTELCGDYEGFLRHDPPSLGAHE
jgi:hypothetical protein